MSRESLVTDFSSSEDIKKTEFSSSDGFFDSGSISDFTASCRRPVKEIVTGEGEVTTSFNTSDEKQHAFDVERTSLSSLNGKSPNDLNRTRKSSEDRQANVLIRKTSVERPLIRNRSPQDCLERPSTRMASSLDPLNKPSTRILSAVDPLEGPLSRMVSPLDPLNNLSTRRLSSEDPLEGPLSRMVSSLDPLNEPSTGSHSSMDPLEESLSKMVSSLDVLNGSSTKSVSSMDPLEGSLSKMVSSLDVLNGSSTKSVSSTDPLEGSLSKMVSSLDVLNGSSTRSVSSMDPVEGTTDKRISSLYRLRKSSVGRVSSMNPLEGPSTQTVWFPDSTEDSLTGICNLHDLEIETKEPSVSEHPTEPSVSCCRRLADFLKRSTRQIRSSKCYLLFNLALLAIPFSAGYMGSRYEKLCDACEGLPMMIIAIGCFGVVMLTFRIASILSKYHFTPPMSGQGFNFLSMYVLTLFIPFLTKECYTTYLCHPVFTPSKANKKFCIKVFYDYVDHLNQIIPFVILLLILVHLPGLWDSAEDEEE